MKKVIALLMALSLVCFSVPVFAAEQAEAPRILVAFLSRAGETYNVGETRKGSASAAYAGYIEKGNTAIMAALIAELTGAICLKSPPSRLISDKSAREMAELLGNGDVAVTIWRD